MSAWCPGSTLTSNAASRKFTTSLLVTSLLGFHNHRLTYLCILGRADTSSDVSMRANVGISGIGQRNNLERTNSHHQFCEPKHIKPALFETAICPALFEMAICKGQRIVDKKTNSCTSAACYCYLLRHKCCHRDAKRISVHKRELAQCHLHMPAGRVALAETRLHKQSQHSWHAQHESTTAKQNSNSKKSCSQRAVP